MLPGDEVGGYTVVSIIGDGGMGVVLEVEDAKHDHFALKYCFRTTEKSLRRFKREVAVMADIHHKHVVEVIDYDLEHDPPYFVMPLAKGSLADEIDDLKQDVDLVLDALEQACLGVQAIHNSQAIHRDIKPSNCLRMDDDRVVICDLGVARRNGRGTSVITKPGGFVGSRTYASPEQLAGEDVDERSDVFSLGKTLYELLTGANPELVNAGLLESGIAHVVQRATKHDPAERYGNVGAFIDAIKLYRQSRDPANNPLETLETLIQQVKLDITENQYDRDTVTQLFTTLTNQELSTKTVIESFASIPNKLLRVLANDMPNEMLPALRRYSDAIIADIGNYGFSYAEVVATKMQEIFNRATNVDVRVLALKTTLVAAVRRHRFAAMDTFSSMLKGLTATDDMAAAEMLSENRSSYTLVAPQVPSDRLRPAVRAVQKSILDEIERESR